MLLTIDRKRMRAGLWAGLLLIPLLVPATPSWSTISSELEQQLESAKYVYISSTRQDGSLGAKAEIWFMYHGGAVYVGTRPTSWRVKRIRWGRPQAKIWVGSPEGPSLATVGEVVNDEAAQQMMLETFGKKYPDGWKKYEESFRKGFKDGSRVLVKYTPVDQ